MKTVITAGLSPVLYHLTGVGQAANILESDRFEMKPTEGTEHEKTVTKHHAYYLSTARNPTSDYFHRNATKSSVILMLDGVKLGQRYSGGPVDYWGPEMRKMGNDEMEDRVISPKPTIPHAKSYILEIHALRETGPEASKYIIGKTYALYRAAKLARIPIYLYGFTDSEYEASKPKGYSFVDNDEIRKWIGERPSKIAERNFLLMNKAKADSNVSIRELFESIDRTEEPMTDYFRKYGLPKKETNDFYGWLFLYYLPVDSKLPGEERRKYAAGHGKGRVGDFLHYLMYYPRDAVSRISTAIHNDRSQPYGKSNKVRENLDSLIGIMRKERVDVPGFVDLLRKKYGAGER